MWSNATSAARAGVISTIRHAARLGMLAVPPLVLNGHAKGPEPPAAARSRPGLGDCDPTRPGADADEAAGARLLPASAAGERVAGDALVARDEQVPVDAAPPKAEVGGRGKRVRVHGVDVGRVRV